MKLISAHSALSTVYFLFSNVMCNFKYAHYSAEQILLE